MRRPIPSTETIAQAWCGDDGRIRGSLNFHNAATGRWSGRGPQPQNFRRDVEQTDAKIATILSGDMNQIKAFGAHVKVVGEISRGMIVAAPGHRLLIGDFTGIESIVLAGVAGQQSKIDQWKKFIASGDLNDHPYMIGDYRSAILTRTQPIVRARSTIWHLVIKAASLHSKTLRRRTTSVLI